MLEKFLQDIGLSEKEAKVYIALLGVDNYSVLELSKKTEINRTTIYPILEKLIADNLISEVKEGKKIHYQAEAPERLESYIEEQKLKLNERSKVIQDVIPRLKALGREEGEKPIVKVYDGREGIIKSTKESFVHEDEGGTAYLMYSKDLINKYFSANDVADVKNTRIKRKIKNIVIYTYLKGDLPPSEGSERIRVDENKFPIKCDFQIYKDRVRINTMGKSLSAIYIKSQDVADTLTTLFKLAFECLNKRN